MLRTRLLCRKTTGLSDISLLSDSESVTALTDLLAGQVPFALWPTPVRTVKIAIPGLEGEAGSQ
jgi:hypothetical protein